MAHISELMIAGRNASSTSLGNIIGDTLPSPLDSLPSSEDKEKYVWRLQQPTEINRKYQLFPATKDSLSVDSIGQATETDTLSSMAMDNEKAGRLKMQKEQACPLTRRRKVSVPELGSCHVPMTTVHEVPMDSPTIPGRPAFHERSISAPGNSWRQHVFGESMLSCISGPSLDENAEIQATLDELAPAPYERTGSRTQSRSASGSTSRTISPHLPSPRRLSPLVIPITSAPAPQRIRSESKSGSTTTPPDVPPKSARMTLNSAYIYMSPFTPSSVASTLTTPSTAPTSIATTPIAVPDRQPSPKSWLASGRSSPKTRLGGLSGRSSPMPARTESPKPWGIRSGRSSPRPASPAKPWTTSSGRSSPRPQISHSSSPPNVPLSIPSAGNIRSRSHTRGQSEVIRPTTQTPPPSKGHRRGESEGSSSIMDRGRPKKRADGTSIAQKTSKKEKRQKKVPAPLADSERLAFETLPQGVSAAGARNFMDRNELEALRLQAIGQATRFEVLTSKDVEELSRELRALDERCDYLRRTHQSLRSGRRNLHDRICKYLRSPRVASFSHGSILKQEEALSELDSSIDDWVSKLEHAENRRTRVRQKLLEHVAAALIMTPDCATENQTPPRSPTREKERLVTSVAAIEVVDEAKILEEEEIEIEDVEAEMERRRRTDVQSIRIYADSDVYALLADVEEEITRMGDLDDAEDSASLLGSPVMLTSMAFSMPVRA